MYCRPAAITSAHAEVPYRYGGEFRIRLGDTATLSPETGEADKAEQTRKEKS
jgi:hypothetical protein